MSSSFEAGAGRSAAFLAGPSFARAALRRAAAFLLAAGIAFAGAPARAGEIVDMAGQHVTVPDEIRSVYAMTHAMPLVAALAPDLLAGFAFPRSPSAETLRFLPPSMAALPNLGGGPDANLETLKAAHVDIALGWTSKNEQYPAKQLARIGLPVVFIDVDRLSQYPATFRFLGRLLHREARGEALAGALEAEMATLKRATTDIAEADMPRVYYAEAIDGLTSQCDASDRAEVIALAGGVNALHCDNPASMAGNYPLDLEKLLTVDPDVIVTRFAQTATAVRTDPRWAGLKAVKTGRVYAMPAYPFNWFDRPPSFMRVMGARWLAAKLHPGRAAFDLPAETRRFYALFFGVTPTDADLDLLFKP